MAQIVEYNGNRIEFPDGMPATEIEAVLKQNAMAIKPKAAAVEAGAAINSIPRQIGLTARYGLEGLANMAQIATEPIRYATDRLTGQVGKTKPLGALVTQGLDAIGLPSPETANERTIGDASRLVAGGGGMIKGAQALGGVANSALQFAGREAPAIAQSAAQKAGQFLAANPGQQLASAAGAGLAGGASREAGGGAGMQALAALGGGVMGGMAAPAIGGLANAGRRMLTPAMTPQQMDQQLSVVLNRAGVDVSQIPDAVRTSLRTELADAMRAGRELNPQAVARLADFRMTNTTATRGMVSQDPVQITREMNLAKMGANSSDRGLQGLAQVQNQNNTRLIGNLNDAGANLGDQFRAGQAAIGGIQGRSAAMEGTKTQAYNALEAMPGYRAPMGANPISNINAALGEEAAMPFMPEKISRYMNAFLAPDAPPFTPQAYNNLQKMLSSASTSADGNERRAVAVAMRALENTPITAGNAVPAAASQAVAGSARDAIGQLQVARAANRDWRTFQESARPISAAVNGAQPDKFVQQFVINGTLDDARAIAQNAPVTEIKNAVMEHLKSKALNGAADEVGKFSQSAFNKELTKIGDRKLSLFFTPAEITALRANGRVASYMQNQPVGSAVNNSNSGALLLGRGYDALRGIAGKIPFGQSLLIDPLTNIEISLRSNQARNVLPGLLAAPAQRPPSGQGLLLPAIAAGGLLSAPSP